MTQPVPLQPFRRQNSYRFSKFRYVVALGVEVNEPILTEEARKAEFTNEGGVGGRIRFLQISQDYGFYNA